MATVQALVRFFANNAVTQTVSSTILIIPVMMKIEIIAITIAILRCFEMMPGS